MCLCAHACVCVCVCMCTCVCVNIKEYPYLTREVWPDDVFGTGDIEQQDVLKKILDDVSGNYLSVCLCECLFTFVCCAPCFNEFIYV